MTLTSKQTKTLIDFHDVLKKGETTYLDPSNQQHNALIKTALNLSGRSEENYPNVYKALKNGKAYRGKSVDKVDMVDIGQTAKGKATATVWSSTNEPTMVNGGTTFLLDKNAKSVVAKGNNTSVRSGFLTCPTRSATARKAGKKLDLLYVGHVTGDDGKTRFLSYANSAPVVSKKASPELSIQEGSSIQATVKAPVTSHGNPQVLIAVGRPSGAPANADYVYVESSGLGSDPYLICPFTGNAALSGTIDLASLTASDVDTNIIINNSSGNAEYLDRDVNYTTDADVVAAFTIGSAPNVLAWDFPFDGVGYQATKSIVYDRGALTTELVSYFYFAFNSIPLTDGSTSPPFFVCSKNSPEESSVNCTTIDDLMFWWHCLAKGTLVTLEDGSEISIEDINQTHRVKTEQGSLAVRATVLGKHTSKANGNDKIYKLTTENGKSLIATETHMIFMIGNQPRKIGDIVVGDIIMTDENNSTVISNELIEYDSMFYGLVLGDEQEQKNKNFPTHMANFYANGILTGDHDTMRYHAEEAHHDLEYMLPRIHEDIHTDYASALDDKRY